MILDESLKPTAYNTGQHRGLYLENMAGSGFGLFNSCRARRSLLLLLLLLLRTLVHGCHNNNNNNNIRVGGSYGAGVVF